LTSEITILERPQYFQDTMLRGAFRMMKHDHYFRKLGREDTEMKDVFCFAAPVPLLGLIAEKFVLRRYMQELLLERNRAVKEIAEGSDWEAYLQAGLRCEL
jgi:ligand-binding SRPBCC domain-containing protein